MNKDWKVRLVLIPRGHEPSNLSLVASIEGLNSVTPNGYLHYWSSFELSEPAILDGIIETIQEKKFFDQRHYFRIPMIWSGSESIFIAIKLALGSSPDIEISLSKLNELKAIAHNFVRQQQLIEYNSSVESTKLNQLLANQEEKYITLFRTCTGIPIK
jgi:hypothetical protein